MHSILAGLFLGASTAHAVPGQFTHQGRLLDADGVPLDGEVTIKFRVTDSEEGGTALWEETLTVPLNSGFYSAILGVDEESNPLNIDVLSQAPVWLELQLDGEPAMFPRSPIHTVPYATMATIAEEIAGGPVDASHIAVAGTPVVNESGEWVGPAPTVNWADIESMPSDFADGVDDDTDTDTDSFADLGTSCLDGDIPVWDAIAMDWLCDIDQDTLAAISCMSGQLIKWDEGSVGWVCADDVDTTLTADEVDAIVADNGYAMSSALFSGSFIDLTDVPDGLMDGDDNTQLTEDQVDAMVDDNGYALEADAFSGDFGALSDIPEGLEDGDNDALAATACSDGQILVYSLSSGSWECGADTNTTLSAEEVQAMVEAVSGLALQAGSTVDGSAILTEDSDVSWDKISGVPAEVTESDSDSLADLPCADGETVTWSEDSTSWTCTSPASVAGIAASLYSRCNTVTGSYVTSAGASCDEGDVAVSGYCPNHSYHVSNTSLGSDSYSCQWSYYSSRGTACVRCLDSSE